MAREYKKGIYTLNEISAEAMKKYPGRWVNTDSAYASVKTISRQLSIGDINGKKKYKQIAAVDVARIFELLEKTNKRKKKAPRQADFFSLLPDAEIVEPNIAAPTIKSAEAIRKAVFDTAPAQIIQTDEKADDLAELYQTADELARAFVNFAQALKTYTKGA